jgi:GMP synthase (glutamine-hydrolysing)
LQENVTNPEEKRRIIGDVFMQVAEEVVRDLKLKPEEVFLGQGTLRPDLIESASELASGKADAIKTHHNDTEMVRVLRKAGLVVEPLKDFHKDEVRTIGRQLGLPESIVQRHPFPGPGLAIRCLCATVPYRCKDFDSCSKLISFVVNYHQAKKEPSNEELTLFVEKNTSEEEREKLEGFTKDYSVHAQLLPIRTVGVQGDARTYSYACAFSSNELPRWKELLFLAKLLPRITHTVNRMVYVFGSQVLYPVTDVTTTFLRPPVLDQLREADACVNDILTRYPEVMARISQMPVVLIPVHFDREPVSENCIQGIDESIRKE